MSNCERSQSMARSLTQGVRPRRRMRLAVQMVVTTVGCVVKLYSSITLVCPSISSPFILHLKLDGSPKRALNVGGEVVSILL